MSCGFEPHIYHSFIADYYSCFISLNTCNTALVKPQNCLNSYYVNQIMIVAHVRFLGPMEDAGAY